VVYAGLVAPPKRITREGVLAKVTAALPAGAAPSMDEMAAAAGVSRAALYGLFGSRAALLEAIGAEVVPSVPIRILAAAGELVAERGLGGLSLDEVAARSGVSRATVYRLYPGRAALFREVVQTYLPMDEALGMMETMADRPPTQVMTTLARGLSQAGYVGTGVLRSVLFEISRREDGTEEVIDEALRNTQVIIRYLEEQMAAGHLRRMDPVLAMQAFLAPVMLHMVSRPQLEEYGLIAISLDEAVKEFTDAWLRAMAPPRRRHRAQTPPPSSKKKARPSRG
jgi:AcrR family transcriptional regulator